MDDEQGSEPVRRTHGVLPALAVALVVVGAATVAYAGWWLPQDLAGSSREVLGLRVGAAALAALALVVGPGAWWARLRTGRAGGVVRGLALISAAGSAGLLCWAAVAAVDQASTGFLGLAVTVSVGGALLGLVGWMLAALVLGGRGGGWPRAFGPVAVVVTALVATAGVVAAAYVVPGVGLSATTARVSAPVRTPDTVVATAWRTSLPSRVRDVLAVGPGVVARVDDGLVAVDGATGRERWSYRRTGAVAQALDLAPGGRTLLLRWSAGTSGRSQLVALDARTGRAQWTTVVVPAGAVVPMSSTTYLTVGDDDRTVTGRSLRTGARQWRYRVPPACRLADGLTDDRFADTVVLALGCTGDAGPATARFVGWRDGPRPAWTRGVATRVTTDRPALTTSTSADGTRYAATVSGTEGAERYSIDPGSGRRGPYVDPTGRDGLRTSRGPVGEVLVTDGPTRVVGQVAGSECAEAGSPALTRTALACVSVTTDGAPQVLVEEYAGGRRSVPVDLGGADDDLRLLVAPGAWVVWSGSDLDSPDETDGPVLVGLG